MASLSTLVPSFIKSTLQYHTFMNVTMVTIPTRRRNAARLSVLLLFCLFSSLPEALAFSALPYSSGSPKDDSHQPQHENDPTSPSDSQAATDPLLWTSFSPESFARSQAQQTANALDASRFHFSVLFVDQDNTMGRLAEALLERIAEYNDALFQIFPASATMTMMGSTPTDATAPAIALTVGHEELGLCETTLTAVGSSFDAAECLPQYDLIIAMDEQIRSQILQLAPPEHVDTVGLHCRTIADFCQWQHFSSSIGQQEQQTQTQTTISATTKVQASSSSYDSLLAMLEPDLHDRVAPLISSLEHSSSDVLQSLFQTAAATLEYAPSTTPLVTFQTDTGAVVPHIHSPKVVQAALILATAGITRFCMDAMNVQMEQAFQQILARTVVCHQTHQILPWKTVAERITLCNAAVAGYFSPKQRNERYEHYCQTYLVSQETRDEPQQASSIGSSGDDDTDESIALQESPSSMECSEGVLE